MNDFIPKCPTCKNVLPSKMFEELGES